MVVVLANRSVRLGDQAQPDSKTRCLGSLVALGSTGAAGGSGLGESEFVPVLYSPVVLS